MKLHFHAKELKKLDDGTYSKKKYSKLLAERLQDRFDYIRESESEQDLRNWKSLHYEKLTGERDGHRSIRVYKKWRLVFEINESGGDLTVIALELVDYHKG